MAYLKEEIKAGVIIVSAFVILSGFVVLIGGSQLFEKLDGYTVRVMNAAGIEEGAQVKLGGVRIGRVMGVVPTGAPGEPITIRIGVKKGTVLYKGTKASISQVGLMGDLYILLSIDAIAATAKERYKPGETIQVEEQVQMAMLMARVDRISQSVEGVMKDIGTIFSKKNLKEIDNMLKNANTTLVSGSTNLDKVGNSLKVTTAKLDTVLNEVEGLVKDTRMEVSPLLKRAREGVEKAGETIKTIETTAKSADRAINKQSQNLEKLLHTLNRTSEDLRDVLHEFKSKPWSVIYKEEQGKEE